VSNRPGGENRPFNGDSRAARGYAQPRGQAGVRSGAFSGYEHGGQTRSFSSRGASSLGGGGARGGRSSAARRRRWGWRPASLTEASLLPGYDAKFRKWREPNAAHEFELRKISLGPSSWIGSGRNTFDGLLPNPLCGPAGRSKTFSSAEEASQALAAAAQNNDEKAMMEILGPAGKQLVSSGDDAEDAQNRANFAQRYQEMHRLLKEPDGTTTLYIGAENWPTPIPLVNSGKAWYFDTEAGKKEILFRRIGRNELSAISVCEQLAAAEKEYHSTQHDEYAQRIFSKQGHDGLYWKTSEGEPPSPIGPLVASAVAEGYAEGQGGPPVPYAAIISIS